MPLISAVRILACCLLLLSVIGCGGSDSGSDEVAVASTTDRDTNRPAAHSQTNNRETSKNPVKPNATSTNRTQTPAAPNTSANDSNDRKQHRPQPSTDSKQSSRPDDRNEGSAAKDSAQNQVTDKGLVKDAEVEKPKKAKPPKLPPMAKPTGKTGTNPGDTLPEIAGEDVDGVEFALSDYEGKVVMLDFWGDW